MRSRSYSFNAQSRSHGLVMLLLTGGRPSGFIVGLSVVLGIGFVVWSLDAA
jgi:hypothetical protein